MNRLVIFHYHLLPGGVTNVIELSIRALAENWPTLSEITLVCGREENTIPLKKRLKEAVGGKIELRIDVDPRMDYSIRQENPATARELEKELLEQYGSHPWLIHNYHLGKNPAFTEALLTYQQKHPDHQALFYIHDFPESGRYENLRALEREVTLPLYPDLPGVSYAVINHRDRQILLDAGIREEKVHLIDNPCPGFTPQKIDNQMIRKNLYRAFGPDFSNSDVSRKLLFYPVRTIRRKNVLEAGLICALSHEPVDLAVSLPGESFQEKSYSEAVNRAFKEGWIPGLWGFGHRLDSAGCDFISLAQSADLILSSSVQEGFGYFFINALQWKKPLLARHLAILDGMKEFFTDPAVEFYTGVKVPAEVSKNTEELYLRKLKMMKEKIGKEETEALKARFKAMFDSETVDFSYLPVDRQLSILQRTAEEPSFKEELRTLNSELLNKLKTLLKRTPGITEPQIEARFGPKRYAENLMRIFEESPRHEAGRSEQRERKILSAFAEPGNFRLLYDWTDFESGTTG